MRFVSPRGLVSLLIVAGGAAFYLLSVYPGHVLRSVADEALSGLPPGTTASYQDAHYSLVTREASFTGIVVHGTMGDPAAEPYDLTIDTLRTSKPNLSFGEVWAKAMANPGATPPDQALPIAESIHAEGMKFRSAAAVWSAGSLDIRQPRIYPAAWPRDPARLWRQALTAMARQPPTPDSLGPLLRLEAAMMLSIGYDGYAAGSMKVSAHAPPPGLTYEVRSTQAGAYDRGVLAGGSIDGLIADNGPAGAFQVGHVTMGESDFRKPLTRIAAGEVLSQSMLDGMKIGLIEYADMIIHPPGQPEIKAGVMSLGPFTFIHGWPANGSVAWKDMEIGRAQLPNDEGRAAFDKLGIDKATVSFALAFDWDRDVTHLVVRDARIAIKELGALSANADLTGIDGTAGSLLLGRLTHAKFRFDDASLTNRLLTAAAASTGSQPAGLAQQLAAMVRNTTSANGGGAKVTAVGDAAATFLTAPKSLTIEIAPPAPLSVLSARMALMSLTTAPAKGMTALGLTAWANQP